MVDVAAALEGYRRIVLWCRCVDLGSQRMLRQ